MKRIMVASDGSSGAERALEAASLLAKTFGSELVIVHVEQGYLQPRPKDPRTVESPDADEVLYGASREILARAQATAVTLGVSTVRTHSGLGDIAGAILDLVEREKPDLIAVGKRGESRLSGLLIGSVSQKVVSLAPCKVLVVP